MIIDYDFSFRVGCEIKTQNVPKFVLIFKKRHCTMNRFLKVSINQNQLSLLDTPGKSFENVKTIRLPFS